MNRAYIFVLITAFLFGSMEVSCKIGGADLDPLQLTFLRFAIGGLVLLPFACQEMWLKKLKLSARDLLILAGAGTLGVPISMVFFQMSIMLSNASTVAVLISTTPFFTMIFAHIFTPEKLNRRKILVLAIAAVAIFFMLRPWDVQEGNTMIGMLLMLVSAFFFGAYTIAGSVIARKVGLVVQTSFSFLIGSAVLLVVILLMGRPVLYGTSDNIPIILYVGICVTGLGYYSYFKAIELSDAATGSFVFFLKPAIAALLARLILRETILWNSYLGIGLFLAASLINILAQKQAIYQARVEAERRAMPDPGAGSAGGNGSGSAGEDGLNAISEDDSASTDKNNSSSAAAEGQGLQEERDDE